MMIRACAGVLCDFHLHCARYAFVDGTRYPSSHWLTTCAPPGSPLSKHVGFIPIDHVGPPSPRQFALTRHDIRQGVAPVFLQEVPA